jgi:Glutaredoxin-like domain (DUF836)
VVYSRRDCPLCEEFVLDLGQQLAPFAQDFEVRDVDADPDTRRRYGMKIPVLTVDGSPVCNGKLDGDAVARLLAR